MIHPQIWEKFNYYWKIGLIIILLPSLVLMFKQFNDLDKEGTDCRKQPFVWGASELSKQYDGDSIFCSCMVGSKSFSFNENIFNPSPILNYGNFKNLDNITI
jgi:hypothetical protein